MSTLPAFTALRGTIWLQRRHLKRPKGEQDRLYDEDEIRSADLKKQQDVVIRVFGVDHPSTTFFLLRSTVQKNPWRKICVSLPTSSSSLYNL
jgi:hypothetical protein